MTILEGMNENVMSSAAPPFGTTVCGIEELPGHCNADVSHVLSILDPDYPVPEVFGAFGEHQKLEVRFHDIIDETPGLVLPRDDHVAAILAFGRDLLAEPTATAHLLVHCHAGISRSSASLALILAQAMPEKSADAVLSTVHRIREKAWPNLRLIEIGDAMLGRNGTLATATHRLHRLQLERRPHIAEFMELGGREREVAAARDRSALP